jgi:hypothetical protein
MNKPVTALGFAGGAVMLALAALARAGGASGAQSAVLPLDSLERLETINTKADIVSYRGRKALHLAPPQTVDPERESMVALVSGVDFKEGTIEADVAGVPITAMDETARGFVGIIFRVQQHGARAENIYVRPTNGRAEDQLRRNHSVQYESIPEFPWHRLREEAPGVYESYVDLEAGAWTRMKIEVAGRKARLYVNGAEQPCLIVNDLKLGDSRGQVGLWAFIATNAYFSNLKVNQTN